jgi:fucose permease
VTSASDGRRRIELVGWAAFALLGWGGLLVPALVRSIEAEFGQNDLGIGLFYLVFAGAYALGSVGGGMVTERIGRRTVLVGSLALQAVGLALQGVIPSWTVFLVAGIPRGLGGGAIDGGVQGLVLDAFPDGASRAMNVVHLFFSIGSLVAPLALTTILDVGVTWQGVMLATAVVAVVLAAAYAVLPMPSGRHHPGAAPSAVSIGLPLVLVAIAIALYVGAEVGVSSWLVRYLATAPLAVATGSLTLFWAGLTVGRLIAARIGQRADPLRIAIVSSVAAALATVGAVVVPSVEASIVLFTVVGIAFGPIYPTIVLVADDLYPGRAAAVTGLLAGVAVVGSVAYPPLMGAISVTAGLGVGMLGAAALSLVCAGLLGVAAARRTPAAPAAASG